MAQTLGFCFVVMLGFLIEATLGFGGTVAALPICSMLVGIRIAVPAITIVVCVASLVIMVQDWKHIDWRAFGTMFLLMALGMPVGMLAYAWLPERPLKILLGLFTLFVACKGLFWHPAQKEERPVTRGRRILLYSCLLLGGVIHGAFSCGGVLAVLYATEVLKEKRAYRVTLSFIWFALNLLITVKNLFTGALIPEVVSLSLWCIPFVAVAILLGNYLHKRLNAALFTRFVYGMLFISGALMIVQSL